MMLIQRMKSFCHFHAGLRRIKYVVSIHCSCEKRPEAPRLGAKESVVCLYGGGGGGGIHTFS